MTEDREDRGSTRYDLLIDEGEEALYLRLCRMEAATTAELCEAAALDRDAVLHLLAGLHTRQLVRMSEHGSTVRWSAVAPDVALERVLAARVRSEQRLHEGITRLLDGYHRGRAGFGATGPDDASGANVVEIVTGRRAIADTWRYLQTLARHEVWVLDKAPFVQLDVVGPELEALGRGVVFRGVYERASLLLPGRLEQIRTLIAAGEAGAMVAEVPFKLGIVDRRWAMLPLAAGAELEGALVIRPSQMLDALIHSFLSQWEKAVPIPPGPGDLIGRADGNGRPGANGRAEGAARAAGTTGDLLTLLTAGLTDEAIARQLHVSARTVQRRVSELMEELGARNRFQAGVQASRHGLL